MTPDQRQHFYLPAWRRAFAVNWQRAGRLGCVPRLERRATDYVAMVEAAALDFAREDGRKMPTEKQLRHAATWVATTRFANYVASARRPATTSSKHLSNGQVQVLVALLDLLADPENLKALTRWLNPHLGELEGLHAALDKYPSAYLEPIVRDYSRGATSDWRSLPERQRWNLLMTVHSRFHARPAAPVPEATRPAFSERGPED